MWNLDYDYLKIFFELTQTINFFGLKNLCKCKKSFINKKLNPSGDHGGFKPVEKFCRSGPSAEPHPSCWNFAFISTGSVCPNQSLGKTLGRAIVRPQCTRHEPHCRRPFFTAPRRRHASTNAPTRCICRQHQARIPFTGRYRHHPNAAAQPVGRVCGLD